LYDECPQRISDRQPRQRPFLLIGGVNPDGPKTGPPGGRKSAKSQQNWRKPPDSIRSLLGPTPLLNCDFVAAGPV
jgi:hypothetical protein